MKELSIEQKAEAYDKAIEGIQEILSSGQDSIKMSRLQQRLQGIFPELKESKNEKIRKEIISYLHNEKKVKRYISDIEFDKWITWLENQAEQKSIWHNEDEEPKRGSLILLIMQSGTPIVAKIIEPKHTFNHGERWAYIDDLLEKQSEQKPVSKLKPKFRIGDVIEVKPMKCQDKIFTGKNNKIIDITEESYILDDGKAYSIELQNGWKLSEQKSDEVEPKFKPGDWISGYYTNYKVLSLNNDGYVVEDVDGDKINILFENEKFHHLFTIADAMDGDVLFQDFMCGKTFIYNGVNPDNAILYSFIISNDGEDVLPYHIGKPNTGIGYIEENKNIIRPATKEQRDLLFQKMKEAGYEWDSKKKELKEIKNKIEIPFGAKDSELKEATYDIPKGFHAEIDNDK